MIIEVVVFWFPEFKEKYIIANVYFRTREYDCWQGCKVWKKTYAYRADSSMSDWAKCVGGQFDTSHNHTFQHQHILSCWLDVIRYAACPAHHNRLSWLYKSGVSPARNERRSCLWHSAMGQVVVNKNSVVPWYMVVGLVVATARVSHHRLSLLALLGRNTDTDCGRDT